MTRLRASFATLILFTACRDDRAASSPGGTSGPDPNDESTSHDPTGGGEADDSTSDAPTATTSGTSPDATDTGNPDPTTSSEEDGSTGDGEPHEVAFCPAQVVQSAYCMAFESLEDRITILGADTGATCPFVSIPAGIHPQSFAWIGDTVVVCNDNTDQLVRIDVVTGAVENGVLPCSAVTEIDGALFVAPSFDDVSNFVYRMYDSFDDVVDGDAGIPVGVQPMATVFAGRDATLFAAYFSTDHIELWDIATASPLPDLVLENHDGAVRGLSVLDTSVFVNGDEGLREFDRVTGAHIDDVAIGLPLTNGLACRPGL